MTRDERAIFESKLAAKGLNWNWSWVDDWRSKVAGNAAVASAAIANAGVTNPNNSSNADQNTGNQNTGDTIGLNLPPSTASTVDWANLDGVDPKVAEELNRLGIKNIEQLEALSPEEREIVEAKLSFDGNRWEWSSLANWKTAAAGAAGAAGLYAAGRNSGSWSWQC